MHWLFIHYNKISSERKLNTSLKLKHLFIAFILKESNIDSIHVN